MNDYFNGPGGLVPFSRARAQEVNAIFQAVADGFDKIPTREFFDAIGDIPEGTKAILASTRYALSLITGMQAGQVASLGEGVPARIGRFGNFVWNPANLAAKVAADPLQGIYVAPASSPTGANGAWVRIFSGPAKAEWFGAKRDAGWDAVAQDVTGTDDTAALQAALRLTGWLELEDGAYKVDAKIGVKFVAGDRITGKGRNKSFLMAKRGGGTIAQLEALTQGSVLKRDNFDRFTTVAGSNPYVTGVYIADLSVVLSHPYASITTTDIQIGIDLRHCRDCLVERCHSGNWLADAAPFDKPYPPNRAYYIQGYGIVCGNLSDSDPAYSGGEANTIRMCHVWETYKAIVMDDSDLSPASAAYHTVVENCDIQGQHVGLAQYGQYGALNTWYSNVLQNAVPQPGNGTPTYLYRMDGYESHIIPGYIEAGNYAIYILYLESSSKRNVIELGGYTAKLGGAITDLGVNNEVRYNANGEIYAGGNDSTGAPQRMLNGISDPGLQTVHNLTGNAQAIPIGGVVVPVSGNGAVRTDISLQNGRYLGQRLTVTANSWGFRFANAAAIWENGVPPEMGGGDQQHGQISFIWTASGWLETTRTLRASTVVPVYVNGAQEAKWDANGLDLSAGNVHKINGQQVVGGRLAAISDVTAGGTTDANARATIAAILTALRSHGLIAS